MLGIMWWWLCLAQEPSNPDLKCCALKLVMEAL
jgi:hypothetical protein